jgi:glycyl-tRNA synthetase beta chain
VELLGLARAGYGATQLAGDTVERLHEFMLERLRSYLRDRDFAADEIESVVGQRPARIDLVVPRLEAVRAFRKLPEAASLAAANKRIRNILRKAGAVPAQPEASLLRDAAERALFAAVQELSPATRASVERQEYADALKLLAGARADVDRFFDDVLVMAEDSALRGNRLALLAQLDTLMNQVADISKLAA